MNLGKCCFAGLDPARPFFDDLAPEELKMTINDAELVDIIHTNSGDLFDVITLIAF